MHRPSRSPRASAPRSRLFLGATGIALALGLLACIWSKPVANGLAISDRVRVAAPPAGMDPAWFPLFPTLALAGLLSLGLAGIWVARGAAVRYEPLAILAAWLACVATSAAVRGVGAARELEAPTVFRLAFLCAEGAVALAFLALVRIALAGGRKRGAWIALAALFVPPAQMWWLMVFFVAPSYVQPRATGNDLVLAEAARASLDLGWTQDLPTLEIFPGGGETRFELHTPEGTEFRAGVSWRQAIADLAVVGVAESGAAGGPRSWTKDQPLYVCADQRVPVGDVLDAIEVCRSTDYPWLAFATAMPNSPARGVVLCCVDWDAGPIVQAVAVDPGVPVAERILQVRSASRSGLFIGLRVDASMSWGEVVPLLADLYPQGHVGFVPQALSE